MKNYLPLGSVVLLKNGQKKLMICGRIQTDVATNISYDYSGCFYPEGLIKSTEVFLFNNENIDNVFFIGYQDEEELRFRKYISEKVDSDNQENN